MEIYLRYILMNDRLIDLTASINLSKMLHQQTHTYPLLHSLNWSLPKTISTSLFVCRIIQLKCFEHNGVRPQICVVILCSSELEKKYWSNEGQFSWKWKLCWVGALNMQLRLVLKSLYLQKRRQHKAGIKMFLPPRAKRRWYTSCQKIL